MYYEEKERDGVLCYKDVNTDIWHEFTKKELMRCIEQAF